MTFAIRTSLIYLCAVESYPVYLPQKELRQLSAHLNIHRVLTRARRGILRQAAQQSEGDKRKLDIIEYRVSDKDAAEHKKQTYIQQETT